MTININVRSVNAQKEIRALAKEIGILKSAMAKAGAGGMMLGGGLHNAFRGMEKFSKNLQWIGRQIEFNFTLPVILAGGVITKWALENERAMIQVRKVYNEVPNDAHNLAEELDLLGESFRLLSDRFGVHQKDVTDVGAMWAQAGASGRKLAEATKLTLEVMILSGMDAIQSTTALIAIQAQYALSTKELTLVMAQLNTIENTTAVSFEGLVDAMSRSAGAARSAGVDWRELASMISAMVPAAGTATEAGNALRTMISRIMAPTGQARDLMRELGLAVDETSWNSQNFIGRLHLIKDAMAEVTTSQQNQVAATIASRWQVNRFNILLNDLTDTNGRYNQSLRHTAEAAETNVYRWRHEVVANEQNVLATYNRELKIFLTSTPQGLSILTTQIRNMLTEGIQPLLPTLLGVVKSLRDMVEWFGNLSPAVKQMIVSALLFLAVMGPVLRVVGAFGLVFSQLGKMILGIGGLFAPWALAFMAAAFVVYIFRDHIADAMRGVVSVVASTVRTVFDLLRRLFSFGSKTSNAGTFEVQTTGGIQRALGGGVPGTGRGDIIPAMLEPGEFVVRRAAVQRYGAGFMQDVNSLKLKAGGLVPGELQDFITATDSARSSIRAGVLSEQREIVISFAPGAGAEFDALVAAINRVQAQADAMTSIIAEQSAVVATWEQRLKAANVELDAANAVLRDMSKTTNRLRDSLDSANEVLTSLTGTPIEGMKAMSDAIFDNEIAQKQLRLEILRMSDAGQSVDDLREKMASLSGEIEMLSGRREDLRLAGAGSDILGTFDAEIAALEAQRNAIQAVQSDGGGISDLEAQLAELQRQGEILNLEEALAFDPLLRQIDDVVNGMQEMPFDELLAAIKEQKATVDVLNAAWMEASEAEAAQQAIVDVLTDRRDLIQDVYDLEKGRLGEMMSQYDALIAKIKEMEDALFEFNAKAGAGSAGGGGGSAAIDDFNNSVGDFDIPGGTGADLIGGGSIEDFNKEMQGIVDGMFPDINLFADLRARLDELKEALSPVAEAFDKFKVAILGVATIILVSYIPALVAAAIATAIRVGEMVVWWATLRVEALKNIALVILNMAKMVAEAVVKTVIFVAQIAIQIASWLLLGAQSLLHAAKVAAAWLLAMGPIGLFIAALALLVTAFMIAWQNSETFRNIIVTAMDVVKLAVLEMVRVGIIALGWLIDKFLLVVTTLVEGAAEAFGWVPGLGEKLKGASDAVNGFRDEANIALAGVKNTVDVMIDSTKARAELQAFANEVAKFTGQHVKVELNGRSSNTGGHIAGLANGGVVDRPTLALIGETARARPEIVTPERLMRQIVREEATMFGGQGTKVYNINGDLSFPNIGKDDADVFISNLEAMVD